MAPPVRCNECRRIFKALPALEQHAKDKGHDHTPPYFCPLDTCDLAFESRKSRDSHVYTLKHHLQVAKAEEESSSEAPETEERSPSPAYPVPNLHTSVSKDPVFQVPSAHLFRFCC